MAVADETNGYRVEYQHAAMLWYVWHFDRVVGRFINEPEAREFARQCAAGGA